MSDNFFTSLIEKGQFRVDSEGHVSVMGEFVFMIPSPVMAKQYAMLEEEMGSEQVADCFHDVGKFQVEQAAERYVEKYNFADMSKERIQDFTQKLIKLIGFGDIEFKGFDREEGKATVALRSGSVLASRYKKLKGVSETPVDHWLCGILDKHFSVIFDVETEVEEVECLAMGDDRCLFEVRVKD